MVVEGYTEAAYLGAVRDWDTSTQFETQPIVAKGQGGLARALQRRNLDAYTTVWVVLDAERHPHTECEKVRNYLRNRAAPQYRLIITSPTIETWLLAHYQQPTGDGAHDRRILQEEHGYESKRNLPPVFDPGAWRMAAERIEGLRSRAREPAGCDLCVPHSDLPALVARLRGDRG